MLSDCKYNKIKILHELSSIVWFLDKCGVQDAKKSQDAACLELFETLRKDLDTYIKKLESAMTQCR